MQFKEYSHITNSYAAAFVAQCREVVPAAEQWVMTEKVHGCNFSLHTDGQTVRGARRGAFLGAEVFHGSDKIIARYEAGLRALHASLGTTQQLSVYGELYGGHYPHPEVKAASRTKPVQKGVFYAPDYCFIAFDVNVGDNYEPWERAFQYCERAAIPFTPCLQHGTLDALLAFDVDAFRTGIPALLGLPPLTAMRNTAEGVVIRPAREYCLNNGERVLLKIKAAAFRELTKDVGAEARKLLRGDTAGTEDREDKAPLIDVAAYVNDARLRTVLSKQPEREFKHRGHVFELVPLLLDDVVDELAREHPLAASLTGAESRQLKVDASAAVKAFLKEKADALIAGTF